MEDVLLTLHGPPHRARQAMEHRIFRRDFLRYYEQELFPAVLAETLGPFLAVGQADLVQFGYQVTMNLTADFAGVDRPEKSPEETASLLALVKKFSEGATLVHSTRDREEVRAEVREALEVFDEQFLQPSIARRHKALAALDAGTITEAELPRDILCELLRGEAELPLEPELLRREIAFYLQAGSHSTANATVHALHDLLAWGEQHPDDLQRAKEDMLFLQRCVHESLRLRPASPVAWRKPVCPADVDGAGPVDEEDRVVLNLHEANRDQSIYGPTANDYDPHRDVPEGREPWGLTFGVGIHTCLGRDLDGGTAQKGKFDPVTHQYGIIALLVRALLDHGATVDPTNPPQEDETTERRNWGSYPVRFTKKRGE
jgi:cytochrome P450